uniref:hypothetical protein n=1 Tax=Prevotella intermedia TaxID=28131 RepID=UPI00195503A9|nr:hypothetical protein [Prevotella intermedia]
MSSCSPYRRWRRKSGGGGSTFSIGSAADWKTFCDRVNGGETTLNAKLTANIELNADIDFGQEIVMVGNQNHLYSGTFDGQGHTLTINWNTGTSIRVSPFQRVKNTTIKNLHVKGEIKSKVDGLTGLINDVYGTTTISGCIIEVNLKAKTILAGMVRWVSIDGKLTITDCIVKGDFTVTKKGGKISGFVCRQYGNCTLTNCLYLGTNNANNNENYTFAGDNTEVKNCYYLNACGKAQGTKITDEQLKNGAVAYKLQAGRTENVWGQKLGTDNEPMPTTFAPAAKKVYQVKFTYNGEVKATRYANSGQGVHGGLPALHDIIGTDYNPHHYYAIAFEGGFNASTTVTADRQVTVSITEKEAYEIASADDWKTFSDLVNNKGMNGLNAKLTKDVDLGSEIVMAGTADPSYYNFFYYTGTFDGQGHTLSFNWNAGKDDKIAPFKYVKDATIKNLRTQGKITTKGDGLSGMVRVAFGTTTISGCISDVDITGGNSGLASSLAAGMVQAVADGASVHITDCLVKGSITDNADEDDRAMAGFVFSNNGTYTLTRCLYVGKNNAPNDSYTFGTETGYGATFTDCYYLNPCGKAQGKQVTAERLKSGEMAKLLQGDRTDQVWGQTLGTDNEPLPTTDATKRVYEVKFVYNGEVKATRYATNGQSIHGGMPTFTAKDLLGTGYNPHHYYAIAFEGGFNGSTTVNTDRTVAVTFNKKDYYEIASKEDWKAFCDIVNGGQNAIDAKMTKDVDFGEDIAKVGTSSNPYGGTFDGQNHVLTVNWDAGSANDVAPFGRVNGATIKNLRTEGFIRSNSFYLSGLIDEAAGGNITVANCVSAVNITSSYTSDRCGAGGLISYIFPSARVTINDCLVKGSINATTEKGQKGMGGFVYVQNGACIMNNCLYAGTNNADNSNNNCYTFAPTNTSGATTTLNNCHYLNPCGEAQGTQVTAERLKSGEMAKLLQGDRTENVWGQTLGTDLEPLPTTDAKKRVYQVKFNYNGNEMASRYANNGQGIHGTLPTAEELLGAGYNPKLTYALNFGDFTANTPVTADKTVDVTVTGTFDIASKADWKTFRDIVNGGLTRVDAKLTQDVDLCKEINIVGNSIEQYEGTFDGQGHTLSFDWTSQGGLAPFYFVDGATIKNLRTKGKITTSGGEASGLLGNAYGTTTISNCVSDVEITSSIDWDACEAAGLVQTVAYNGKVTVTDCVVKGNINATTEKGQKGMAGFVYELEDGGACTLTNCLYVGKNNGVGDECYTFAPAGITLNNCYYLNACGKAQGDKITEAQLKNGYVAHKLQAGRTDNVWGQTLGTDNEPQLTTEKAKHVYKVDFKYMDEVKATRYANSGGRVKLPTAKELLGADYDAQKSYTLTFENGFSETTAINGDITVSVTVNVVTGIDGVTDDNSTVRGAVYNLQGVRVAESSDAETLRRLPAGVYIVKGKKFVVR